MKFSKRLDLFGDEIFAALNERRLELEKQGKKIYNMSVGTPDFHTPDHIKKALMDAAADDQNWRYSLRDLPELLDAVCAYYKKRFQVDITPDMVIHNGTTQTTEMISGFCSGKQAGRRSALLLSAGCRA